MAAVPPMDKEHLEALGDAHVSTSVDTPLRPDAFALTEDEKIEVIQSRFADIMHTLGLDLTDDSLSGTPYRFAKMYVTELFYGLNPAKRPKLSTFENKYGYQNMVIEKNITLDSACEHHFLPIVGHAHVAYIPKDKVVGLSKINRLVDYYSHRPQVQERLCLQIRNDLQQALGTDDVLVMITAKHLCVSSRGIKDKNSETTTLEYGGVFHQQHMRTEFLRALEA